VTCISGSVALVRNWLIKRSKEKMITDVIDKLKQLFNRFSGLAIFGFPLKMLFAALAVVFGSAGLLGYVSDYATYYYAISMGFRPPLEGVPYLATAITLGSIFLLLGAALSFLLVYLLLRWLGATISLLDLGFARILPKSSAKSIMDSEIRKMRLRYRLLFALLLGVIFAIISHFVLVRLGDHVPMPFAEFSHSTLVAAIAIYAVAFGLISWVPASIWPLSALASVIYFCAVISLLFQPIQYAKFLRFVGYGGGLPITIHSKDEELRENLVKANTSLILRTNDTLIVLEIDVGRFMEIPRDEVLFFTYKTGGLYAGASVLPKLAQ
jgi:hypothetical protein